MTIHMVKLCVGADTIEDLADWQTRLLQRLDHPVHHTRMAPKRAEEMLDGGSIYWVIKRAIRILFEPMRRPSARSRAGAT
jgi:hypothetical protein